MIQIALLCDPFTLAEEKRQILIDIRNTSTAEVEPPREKNELPAKQRIRKFLSEHGPVTNPSKENGCERRKTK